MPDAATPVAGELRDRRWPDAEAAGLIVYADKDESACKIAGSAAGLPTDPQVSLRTA